MKKSMSKLLALTLLFCMLTSSALAADTLEVARYRVGNLSPHSRRFYGGNWY